MKSFRRDEFNPAILSNLAKLPETQSLVKNLISTHRPSWGLGFGRPKDKDRLDQAPDFRPRLDKKAKRRIYPVSQGKTTIKGEGMRQPDYFWGLFGAAVLSVPFYFLWNKLAPVYFYQIPSLYRQIPFWHCVGLFLLIAILRAMLFPIGTAAWDWRKRTKD
jgi:hypothetical protein